MNYIWSTDHRRKVREHAVSDVLGGMSLIGAAVQLQVQVADLRRWVDDARDAGQDES